MKNYGMKRLAALLLALMMTVTLLTGCGTAYCIPTVAHVWGNRTVEQPLTVFWTMNKLYPELESEEDLTTKIKYFYSHFFNYDLSDEQVSSIIGNSDAA